MSVLCDRDIREAIKDKRLFIDPEPNREYYAPTSVDLTLDDKFLQWDFEAIRKAYGEIPPLDIQKSNYVYLASQFTKEVEKERDGSVILPPEQFMLAQTKEIIHLPITSKLAGRIEGKSSRARMGLLVHFTAPTIHAGFRGPLVLEIYCVGRVPLRLKEGYRICQLIVEVVTNIPTIGMDDTQFQGQTSPRGNIPSE